jgi:hypothetical protein
MNMKKYIALLVLICSASGSSAQLVIKGRVKCMNPTMTTTKGAENIIIVPAFLPSKSVMTVTRPSGYFEFNTGIELKNLYEKQISLYVISQCSNCRQSVRRVFISEDQDRKNRTDGKTYFTVPDWMLELNCSRAELPAFRADSILNVISKQPGVDPDKVSKSSSLLGTPMFLNFLTNLVTVVSSIPANAGNFVLTSMDAGEITYGNFLQSSPLYQTANKGFNFAPNRDFSEAGLWNPSAIVNSRKNINISLLTNLKNNAKISGFTRLTDKISVGAGVIYTRQDELRQGTFLDQNQIPNRERKEDSLKTKLQEYGAFLSSAYQVNNKLSLGLTIKSVWQGMRFPSQLTFPLNNGVLTDTIFANQHFDADLSATYKLSPSVQVGINVMNIAGTQLHGDVSIENAATVQVNQRSLGLGICYKYQRWNFGADVIITQDDFYDAAIGVNYVPFNNALISAGVTVKQLSYSVAFRMKHFRVAYVDDNGTLINQMRPGKISLLGGKIYGGFIFDLD